MTLPPPVTLLPPRPEHVEAWACWRAEPTARRLMPLDALDRTQLARRLAACSADLTDRQAREHRWMVARGTEVVGTVAARIAFSHGAAELAFLLGEAHQGQGVGTRAVQALVERLFGEAGLHRLWLSTAAENVACQRLVARLGFSLEGRMRAHLLVQGRRLDQLLYGLLRTEWEAQRRAR